jgi:hypothetical protein
MPEITLRVSSDCEFTSYPWWMIVDPHQNMRLGNEGVHEVASMITGPFFSREEAEMVLQSQRYNFGKDAVVYCASGHNTIAYRNAIRHAEADHA